MRFIELELKDFKSWGSRAGIETRHLHSHDVNCMGMDMALWHGELRGLGDLYIMQLFGSKKTQPLA